MSEGQRKQNSMSDIPPRRDRWAEMGLQAQDDRRSRSRSGSRDRSRSRSRSPRRGKAYLSLAATKIPNEVIERPTLSRRLKERILDSRVALQETIEDNAEGKALQEAELKALKVYEAAKAARKAYDAQAEKAREADILRHNIALSLNDDGVVIVDVKTAETLATIGRDLFPAKAAWAKVIYAVETDVTSTINGYAKINRTLVDDCEFAAIYPMHYAPGVPLDKHNDLEQCEFLQSKPIHVFPMAVVIADPAHPPVMDDDVIGKSKAMGARLVADIKAARENLKWQPL